MGAEYLAFVMYTSRHLFSCSIGCDFELFQHEQFHGCHRHHFSKYPDTYSRPIPSFISDSVSAPDLEVRGWGEGGFFFSCPAGFSSFSSLRFFFTQNRGVSPKSATETDQFSTAFAFFIKGKCRLHKKKKDPNFLFSSFRCFRILLILINFPLACLQNAKR